MLNHLVAKYVCENLQWFFENYLQDHYNRRRDTLGELSKKHETQQKLIPAIDYLLNLCVDKTAQYPPREISRWHDYYSKLGSGQSHIFQQLLLIYLKLDLSNYLSIRERESTTGRQTRAKDRHELNYLQTTLDKLMTLPKSFDFSTSVIRLSTGLWALDNDQDTLMISCLSCPSVNLTNYFENSRDLVQLIIGTLHCQENSRMALYISKIHRYENFEEEYDQLHAHLLIQSGQLNEALKYERNFMDQEDYQEILQRFFELCSRLDVTKSLNCLNLSVEEEEALNQYSPIETRPVTPASGTFQQPHIQSHHVTISTPIRPPHKTSLGNSLNSSSANRGKPTPRNRNVQALRRIPSFNDSPAKNTRSARKKKVEN